MTDTQPPQASGMLAVSNASTALHNEQFGRAVETITGRTVYSFASATDPEHGVVMEIFVLEPQDGAAGADHGSTELQ